MLKEAKKGDEEIKNVRNAIIKALGDTGCNMIKDIDIRPNGGESAYTFRTETI